MDYLKAVECESPVEKVALLKNADVALALAIKSAPEICAALLNSVKFDDKKGMQCFFADIVMVNADSALVSVQLPRRFSHLSYSNTRQWRLEAHQGSMDLCLSHDAFVGTK